MYRGRQEFMKFFVFLFLSVPRGPYPVPPWPCMIREQIKFMYAKLFIIILRTDVYIYYIDPSLLDDFSFLFGFFGGWLIARILILFYRTHALLLYIYNKDKPRSTLYITGSNGIVFTFSSTVEHSTKVFVYYYINIHPTKRICETT